MFNIREFEMFDMDYYIKKKIKNDTHTVLKIFLKLINK